MMECTIISEPRAMTGVVLAGGMNRRMGGRMKALLQLEGKLFIERQLTELSKLCTEIIITANEPELFKPQLSWPDAEVRLVRDIQPGKGPLAGMQAAMTAASYEELWVVACDMPYINAAAAALLAEYRRSFMGGENFDAALPALNGRIQPLHAVYHRRCLQAVNEQLDIGSFRVMELLRNVKYVEAAQSAFEERGISSAFVMNVNDPSDLAKLNS